MTQRAGFGGRNNQPLAQTRMEDALGRQMPFAGGKIGDVNREAEEGG